MSVLLAYSGDMGEGEVITTLVCLVAAAVYWAGTARSVLKPTPMVAPGWARAALLLTPMACIALMGGLIDRFGDSEVRGDWRYVGMYTAMGAAWLATGPLVIFPVLGLHGRVDGLERRNAAAVIAHAGALLGLTLCYVGGNFGDGPSWTVVVISSGMATAAMIGVWAAVEGGAKISKLISLHRDPAAGLRLAGLLICCGMIFGRSAAGTWVSTPATAVDMLIGGWPALAPMAMEILLSRSLRPTPTRLRASALFSGAAPALAYIGFGAGVVYAMGWWT